jgi:hypothetical protein
MEVVKGNLEVTKRAIYVKTHTHEFLFDGNVHSDCSDDCLTGYSNADLIIDYVNKLDLLEGHLLVVDQDLDLAWVKDLGDIVDNEVSFKVVDALGNDLSGYYEIHVAEFGKLSIIAPPDDGEGDGEEDGDDDGGEMEPWYFYVNTDTSGVLYLRMESYQDYAGTVNWTKAKPYQGDTLTNPLYFAGIAMERGGVKASTITIKEEELTAVSQSIISNIGTPTDPGTSNTVYGAITAIGGRVANIEDLLPKEDTPGSSPEVPPGSEPQKVLATTSYVDNAIQATFKYEENDEMLVISFK